MKNVSQTYLLQYAQSPIIKGIIERYNDAMDTDRFEKLFLKNIVDPKTANEYGLEIWSRIVGTTDRANVVEDRNFGFAELLSDLDGVNSGIASDIRDSVGNFGPGGEFPFLSPNQDVQSSTILDGDDLRALIFAKGASNISTTSSASMNNYLMLLCGDASKGNYIWTEDNGNMTVTVCYNFYLSAILKGALFLSGVIARPTGVKILYKQVDGLPNG